MDRLARLIAIALVAACGATAPTAGTGVTLRPGATPAVPASGLRTARTLSRGALTYAAAFAGDRLLTIELATAFELVVRDGEFRETARLGLGEAAYDVGDLAVDPRGELAWVASRDGRVRALDLARAQATTEWRLGAPATAVAVSPDGAHLATGDATGVLCLRRIRDGALLQCVAGHEGAIGDLDFTDGKLASAAWSGEVVIWSLPSLTVVARHSREGSANAVAWSPTGDRLAVGWSLAPPVRTPAVVDRERQRGFGAPDAFATIEVLTEAAAPTTTLRGHAAAVTDVAWTPDGARLISSSWDRTVRLWDARTGRALAQLGGFSQLVRGVAVSPDGRHVVAAAWAAALDARATTLIDLLYPR